MKAVAESEKDGGHPISHFGPEANEFEKLEGLFKSMAKAEPGKPGFICIRMGKLRRISKRPGRLSMGINKPWFRSFV